MGKCEVIFYSFIRMFNNKWLASRSFNEGWPAGRSLNEEWSVS